MQEPNKYLRAFFFLLVRIFVLIFLGLNVRRKNLLPEIGPAIVVANHNSHLDTLVLISLFPLVRLPNIRPVAAADYFLKNRFAAWFSTRIIGIIPIDRGLASKNHDSLEPCYQALGAGKILILFPEGTRGEPEKLSQFKKGVAWIAERFPHIPVTPVFIYGLGKALPKDDLVLVPFFCDLLVGEKIPFSGDKNSFMTALGTSFKSLADEGHFSAWE